MTPTNPRGPRGVEVVPELSLTRLSRPRKAWGRLSWIGFGLALALVSTPPAVGAPPAPTGAPPAAPKAEEKKPAVVPFELLASNHMVVRARVNGAGPFRLIFDLGAPITLLSPKASELSGVIKKGSARPMLFGARGEERVRSLKVGELTATDLPVVVMDHPTLRVLGGLLGRPLDGIIGFTFFARYKTTIDYAAREMTFEPVEFELPDLLKDLPARLAGPKVARRLVLAPGALFGLAVAEAADNPGAGVSVSAVAPGSPAEAAGLKPGDLLTTLDGRWTTSVTDAYAAAATLAPGHPVEAVVVRDGKERSLTVTPVEGF